MPTLLRSLPRRPAVIKSCSSCNSSSCAAVRLPRGGIRRSSSFRTSCASPPATPTPAGFPACARRVPLLLVRQQPPAEDQPAPRPAPSPATGSARPAGSPAAATRGTPSTAAPGRTPRSAPPPPPDPPPPALPPPATPGRPPARPARRRSANPAPARPPSSRSSAATTARSARPAPSSCSTARPASLPPGRTAARRPATSPGPPAAAGPPRTPARTTAPAAPPPPPGPSVLQYCDQAAAGRRPPPACRQPSQLRPTKPRPLRLRRASQPSSSKFIGVSRRRAGAAQPLPLRHRVRPQLRLVRPAERRPVRQPLPQRHPRPRLFRSRSSSRSAPALPSRPAPRR